jgi:hypothetical protein
MKRSFCLLVGLFCFVFYAGCTYRSFISREGHRIRVLDHGIYKSQLRERIPHPGFTSGGLRIRKDFVLQEQTDTVPAKRGIRFGFRYVIYPADASSTIPVTVQWIFPDPGLINTITGRTDTMNEVTLNAPVREELLIDYGLDYEWECVPGKWIFRLIIDENIAAQRKFIVYEEDNKRPTRKPR